MKFRLPTALALAVVALGSAVALSQAPPLSPVPQNGQMPPPPFDGPPPPPNCVVPPPAVPPPVTPPATPARDTWVLSVVKDDGQPRLQIHTGAQMQALSASLAFKVTAGGGEVAYIVSAGRQVQVRGGSLQASAERVTRDADGVTLRLEGQASLRWERNGAAVEMIKGTSVTVNLQTGRVTVEMDPQQSAAVQPCCTSNPDREQLFSFYVSCFR